jgi:hypothetical protein
MTQQNATTLKVVADIKAVIALVPEAKSVTTVASIIRRETDQ